MPKALLKGAPAADRGHTMKYSAIVSGTAALICGLIAARYWHRASKVMIEPRFHELSEDVHETDFNWELMKAIMIAGQKSNALNRAAALWSAAAVVLGGLTSLVATLIAY
jgi:hypothetical protein